MQDDLIKSLEVFLEKCNLVLSSTPSRKKRHLLIKLAQYAISKIGRKKFDLIATAFYETVKRLKFPYLEAYIESVYFGVSDYKEFLKLEPSAVVRMMRFYFKKTDGTPKIPITYGPLLLKIARRIKVRIKNAIAYRAKKNPVVPLEAIFEELRKEYFEKKKYFSFKKRRRKRKKVEAI
ncbi:MAG: hypothetical protein C0169_04820 [Thermodesulfobacterium geofontis]|uniref:Uncharacterized protein n=1 Tax=Thermodesulfobacterium geofontis TaxID=1295609 RepID=A0A2N7QC67_9BACT|nr:MAG: hypothetical protein C0169_04820 [Thermodesulfobacterium geofontis]